MRGTTGRPRGGVPARRHVDPRCQIHGHAFVAVYLFDAAGKLLEARIDDMGEYGTLDGEAWGRRVEQRFTEL